MPLTLAVTADLHWGHRRGNDETRLLVDFLRTQPPDILILAGDIGTSTDFAGCLELFRDLPSRKVLVPGNHDIWVARDDPERDSLLLYDTELPAAAAAAGFQYLDAAPLILPEHGLALVGSINWYDYSWGLENIRRFHAGEEERVKTKRFTRGRHNDANFVRWKLDDDAFTTRVVAAMERQLDDALAQVERAIVVVHHPPFRGLLFPREATANDLDTFLWDAFCGNQRMEDLLARRAERIPLVFCGHTHSACSADLGAIHGHNIGGDYHYKRLLQVEWPEGKVTAHQFGS